MRRKKRGRLYQKAPELLEQREINLCHDRLESDQFRHNCTHSPLEHLILCHRQLRFARHIFNDSSSALQQSLKLKALCRIVQEAGFFKQWNVRRYYIHDCLFQSPTLCDFQSCRQKSLVLWWQIGPNWVLTTHHSVYSKFHCVYGDMLLRPQVLHHHHRRGNGDVALLYEYCADRVQVLIRLSQAVMQFVKHLASP